MIQCVDLPSHFTNVALYDHHHLIIVIAVINYTYHLCYRFFRNVSHVQSWTKLWICLSKAWNFNFWDIQKVKKWTILTRRRYDTSYTWAFYIPGRNFIFRNPARNSTITIAYCVNNLQCLGYFLLNKKIDELTSKNGSTENRTRVNWFIGVYLYH